MPASAFVIDFKTTEDWFENLLSPEHDRSGLEENILILQCLTVRITRLKDRTIMTVELIFCGLK